MMKSKLSCNTIKDLLPIYIDELSSNETNTYVKEHLDKCTSCQSEYEKLNNYNNTLTAIDDISIVKKFKSKIIIYFISIVVLSIVLIILSIISTYPLAYKKLQIPDLISIIAFDIGIYFTPLLSLLICWIWKTISPKSNRSIWCNIFITFLSIIILFLITYLFFKTLKVYNFYGLIFY